MRGPLLFLAAVALAAAAAVLVVLPAIRQRSELRKDVATAAAEPESASPLAAVRPELARAAAPLAPAAAARRLAEIAREYEAAENPAATGDDVLVVEWKRLPALLHSLADVAGILQDVRVEPGADAARCRVTLVRVEEHR